MKRRTIRVNETVDRRVLGALRCVDQVTGRMLKRPLRISGQGLKFFPNRSFFQVISYAEGLALHLDAFEEPPDTPAPRTLDFNISIQDPSGEYLERLFAFQLPRVPNEAAEHSLFNPIDVAMFASPAARLSPNWSIIRASIYDFADPEAENPVPGALLRILDSGDRLLMSGLSDQRGEAAVIIPGIPITSFSLGAEPPGEPEPDADGEWLASGPVIETQTPVTLEVIVRPGAPWPVNPGEMEERHAEWRKQFRDADSDQLQNGLALALKTGKTQSVKLFVNLT